MQIYFAFLATAETVDKIEIICQPSFCNRPKTRKLDGCNYFPLFSSIVRSQGHRVATSALHDLKS